MKKLIFSILAAGAIFSMASCCKATDDNVPAQELAARKSLSVSEGYFHGDVFKSKTSYKLTATLLSEGMNFAYTGYTADYAGFGYVLEIEFNSADSLFLTDGTYVADSLLKVTTSGNTWAHKAYTYNPDNTSITYQSGNKTNYTFDDATFEVSHLNDDYVIVARTKTSYGSELVLTFKGVLKFSDVYAYLEPKDAQSKISFTCNAASLEASASNEAVFGTAYENKLDSAPLEFTLTLSCGSDTTVTIDLWESIPITDQTTVADFKTFPSSGTYTTSEDAALSFQFGIWNMLNSKSEYDTTKKYRGAEPYGSYLTLGAGKYFYLGNAETDSVQIKVDDKGNVTGAKATLTSYNGTPFVISYGTI